MENQEFVLENVKQYYGEVLSSNGHLKTSACCSATSSLSKECQAIVSQIHPEVLDRFYGCGSPFPPLLEGLTVLDLGSGTGRDCFVLSKLVGPHGRVIGVDMTPSQIAIARKHVQYHMNAFEFTSPNVEFFQAYIEDLLETGIKDNSVDVVISNCVINLSPDKRRVFGEMFRVLKPGGELLFSDIFSDRRIPETHQRDAVLHGECLGGALYFEDFRRILAQIGCLDFRVVTKTPVKLRNAEIEAKIGNVNFESATIRAFKLPLEDACEDYGQVAYYQGSIPEHPHEFILDDHHTFPTSRPVLVCGNTAAMLQSTRYGAHFRVEGDRSMHFGLFNCSGSDRRGDSGDTGNNCC